MSTDIHQKILGLLALAENNPSEEEAATAANMARKLMMKYNIEQKELGIISSVEYSEVHTTDRDYFATLGHAVREMTGVTMVHYGREHFRMAGTRVNTQIAHSLLLFLAEQVESMYKNYLPPGMTKAARAQYRKDFKRNCALRIMQRAREQKFHVGTTGTQLVLIQNELEKEVEAFLIKSGVRQRTSKMKIRTGTRGAQDGQAAGNAAQLQKRVQH